LPALSYGQDSVEHQQFFSWLDTLRTEAVGRGVSESTLALALADIQPPVERIITNDRSQPEVVQTYAGYLSRRVSDWKKTTGMKMLQEHAADLSSIAKEFGVQPRFIASIWGMETNYGTYPITEPVFTSLATLAYDSRRSEFFRSQFFAALEIVDKGYTSIDNMKGSWAGALGQPQFMPDSYLALAVDYDGDGERDIWNTEADVLASIANFLRNSGWQDDQTWGRGVKLPPGGEISLPGVVHGELSPDQACSGFQSLGVWRDLQDWQDLGVRRINGTDLPTRSIPAALILADKGDDKGYLVYRNFCSIMKYNPSFRYALSIGLLADQFVER